MVGMEEAPDEPQSELIVPESVNKPDSSLPIGGMECNVEAELEKSEVLKAIDELESKHNALVACTWAAYFNPSEDTLELVDHLAESTTYVIDPFYQTNFFCEADNVLEVEASTTTFYAVNHRTKRTNIPA